MLGIRVYKSKSKQLFTKTNTLHPTSHAPSLCTPRAPEIINPLHHVTPPTTLLRPPLPPLGILLIPHTRPYPHPLHPLTPLPQNLPLLLPHQPHRAPHKRGQQIRNIKRLYDRRQHACRRATLIAIRGYGKGEEHEDHEEGHFAGEDERGEARVDVVVGHVFGGGDYGVPCEDGYDELWQMLLVQCPSARMWKGGGRTVCSTFNPMMLLNVNSFSRILCLSNFALFME